MDRPRFKPKTQNWWTWLGSILTNDWWVWERNLTSSQTETSSSGEQFLALSRSMMDPSCFGWRGVKPVANLEPLRQPTDIHLRWSPGNDSRIGCSRERWGGGGWRRGDRRMDEGDDLERRENLENKLRIVRGFDHKSYEEEGSGFVQRSSRM